MLEAIDIYCERLGPGLLAEPVNAVTNAAFFVAAWLAWRIARRDALLATDIRLLLALIVTIGIGSTLFHTFATVWARVLDQLPILVFQLTYLWVYARRVILWPRWAAAVAIAAYLVAGIYSNDFPQILNGSLAYAPALLLTVVLASYHAGRRLAGWPSLAAAVGVFVAALAMRTLDEAVCTSFPLGTHFLWHVLVAAVAYLCMRALLAQIASGRDRVAVLER